jgi:hypothetical protein
MSTWPQWIVAAYIAIIFVVGVHCSAKFHRGDFAALLVDFALAGAQIGTLYAGGFWGVWGWTP